MLLQERHARESPVATHARGPASVLIPAPRVPVPVGAAVPALVLGQTITALGVVRGLARLGVPVYGISADPEIARFSRWYRRLPGAKLFRDGADLAAYLRPLPLDRAVLIAASDHGAVAAASLPPDLRRRFPTCVPSARLLAQLSDKEGLRRLLDRFGVPHPRTVAIESEADVHLADALDIWRVFIKPRDSQEFLNRFGRKAVRPSNHSELLVLLRGLMEQDVPVVLQEYVPGPSWHHYYVEGFLDATGSVRAHFARQRLRMPPGDFTNSSATRSVPLDVVAPAVRALDRLMTGVGYRGAYSAELKRDARDGVLRCIEINVRPWWYIEFAETCGVNFVEMIYRDALGLPVPGVGEYRSGRSWIYPYYDFQACRHLVASGRMSVGHCVRSWLGSGWVGFAADDPMPGIVSAARFWWSFLGRHIGECSGRIRERVRTASAPLRRDQRPGPAIVFPSAPIRPMASPLHRRQRRR